LKWLDKIIGTGKPDEQKTDTIAFDELKAWAAHESQAELDELSEAASQIITEIIVKKDQLVRDVDILEAAEPSEEPSRISKLVLAARDSLLKQINTLIDKIIAPEMNYSDIGNFHTSVNDYLNLTLEKSFKSHQRVKYMFPKEVGPVIADVGSIKRSLDRLGNLLDERKAKIENFGEISENIRLINEIESDLITYNSKIKSAGSKIDAARHEIDDCAARLDELSESEEWGSFVLLERELKQRESEIDALKNSAMELFTPLGKALNRMKKLSSSGRHTLSKKNEGLLDICLKNPISADTTDINGFLTEIMQLAESGTLGLKDKKRDKIIDQIRHIMSSFASKKEQHEALDSQINEINRKVSDLTISDAKATLEKQHTEKTRKIVGLEKELVSVNEELNLRSEELENRKRELSGAVNLVRRMDILFD